MASKSNTPNWMRFSAIFTIIATIFTSVGSATIWLDSRVSDVIETVVNKHDHGYKDDKEGPSHNDLREELTGLAKEIAEINVRQRADRSDLIQAYWYLVGYAAADAEPLNKLKAAAAAHYRSEFLIKCKSTCEELKVSRCRRDKMPYIQDVYRIVLGTSWAERARLVRALR